MEAGLSKAAVDHIITQYPHYLGWDVEQKLLPRLQRWQQELGNRFLREIERIPYLLLKIPEEEQLKDQYLASIGIQSPERLRKKSSYAFERSLGSLQGKVAFLQACGFTRAQVTSVVEKDPMILSRSSEYVEKLLRVIGDLFDCAEDMNTIVQVILISKCVKLSSMRIATLHHNFPYFCTQIAVDDKTRNRAWRDGVFSVAPAELDIRLNSIAAQLDSTLNEAKAVVRGMPVIATLLPETVGLHVTQLLGLGFCHGQVKSMCLRQPVLLMYSYSSDVRVAKWGFLTCVLQLSHDAIAACPQLLMSSLPNRLGPRWEYLQQLRLHGLIAFTAAPQVSQSLVFMTDSAFRAAYTTPQWRVYDEHFQKQWQRKWEFLLVDQQLSIQDIGDNPALLHISLKDC